MTPLHRVAVLLRASLLALVAVAVLAGGPLLVVVLSQWVPVPDVGWFHYTADYDAPPFAQQVHLWFVHTYETIRLDLDERGLVALVGMLVLGGSWLGLVWITLSTLWCLARNGLDALRERAASWGPRGWIASLLTTLVLSGTASPAYAATPARTVATAPQHPHHEEPHSHGEGTADQQPVTPGDHTQPPPRQPGVHLPDDIRPDCARYRVHRTDTLTTIAERELGTIARWHDLARVNAFQLGHNPDHLEPGWEILLPPEAAPPKQNPTKVVTTVRGDTLWAIAERELGTPNRWGELWDLNVGRTQTGGLQLSLPDRIQPGWHIVVPDEPHNTPTPGFTPTAPPPSKPPFTIHPWPDPHPPAHENPPPQPSPGTDPSSGHQPTPGPQAPDVHGAAPDHPSPQHDDTGNQDEHEGEPWPVDGVEPAPGVFLGLGLAAAISLALARARLKHRSTYVPGQALSDYQPAPTVYALRIAHLNNTRNPETGEPETTEHTHPTDTDHTAHTPTPRSAPPPEATPHTPLPVELGVHNQDTVRLDVATCQGLGLSGPTHTDAVRALLLHLLSRHTPREETPTPVIMTRADANLLLPDSDQPPATVQLVDDLPDALDLLERTDTNDSTENTDSTQDSGATHTVLIARSPVEHAHRLHTLLRSRHNIAAVFLGPWPDGVNLTLNNRGVITHTTPESSDHLRGTHVFTATPEAGNDLLPLTPTPRTPLPPPPPPVNPWTLTFGHDPRHTCSPTDIEALLTPSTASNNDEASGEQSTDAGQHTRAHPDTPPLVPVPETSTSTPDTDPAAPPAPASHAHSEPRGDDDGDRDSAHTPARQLTTRSEEAVNEAPANAVSRPDTAAPDAPPLRLRVFGRFELTWTPTDDGPRDLTPVLGNRQRDMLTYLALHPDGVTRASLITDVWGEARRSRPTNALNTLLYRLRDQLRHATNNEVPALIDSSNPQRYHLTPGTISCDYGDLTHALNRLRTDNERTDALHTIISSYTGNLAPYLDAEWIEHPRTDTHRAYINAIAELTHTYTDQHPRQTLQLLETATEHDPLNETLYRGIMQLQHQLGLNHAIPATLKSLRTHLHSIDTEPSTDTTHLAHTLTHPHS